ncbi:HAMP domain-containing sensor histidine kinase [Bacillus sp. OAE603]|uniref:sensor histidine kinase n=1 Tax=Gottfriedia sp. OAE603 TaxID=2663872 RepID=UPI0017897741
MKSIYTKLVVVFISVIILSLVLTFFIASKYFLKNIIAEVQGDLNEVGENFISIYQNEGKDEIQTTLNILSKNYSITIYDHSNKVIVKNNAPKNIKVKEESIRSVLNGQYFPKIISDPSDKHPYVVGIPFERNSENYALFIQPNFERGFFKMHRILFFSLLTTLIIGSITFLFVAKLLAKPIKALTVATNEVAKGNYDVRVAVNRKDEIGFLASHFNVMTEKLGKLEEMRSEFVSNVSHEIQSPLTSIKGFAKVLKNKELVDEKREYYISIIEEETERLSILSERLLKLASLDSDQHPFEPTTYHLDEQIRKVIVALEPHWERKKLQLILNLPQTKIVADRLLLEQVWINLLQNAFKYSNIGGIISVDIIDQPHECSVIIKDNGIGISKENIERIFERFFQADQSRHKHGTGLGLSIVQKIIEMHEAKIMVNSTIGEGTSFTVILPKS